MKQIMQAAMKHKIIFIVILCSSFQMRRSPACPHGNTPWNEGTSHSTHRRIHNFRIRQRHKPGDATCTRDMKGLASYLLCLRQVAPIIMIPTVANESGESTMQVREYIRIKQQTVGE